MLTLETELIHIKGINRRLLRSLEKLNIKKVRDLLWHFPFRYEDFSQLAKIKDLNVDQTVTVRGAIQKINYRRTWQKRMIIIEALIADESGGIKAIWFNQPYLIKSLPVGRVGNFAGKVVLSKGEMYLANPTYESNLGETKHTAGLIPIYPETRGLTSKGLRYLVKPILAHFNQLQDFIPQEVLDQNKIPEINEALRFIHFPQTLAQAELARRRFAFEDLLLLQINNIKARIRLNKERALAVDFVEDDLNELINNLPFSLTNCQKQSLEEIVKDIKKPHPMNRLLQGDVGSGKTVVAAIAAILIAKNGCQAAFMAPTEVLAQQHYKTLIKIFGKIIEKWGLNIALLTGSEAHGYWGENLETKLSKKGLENKISSGEIKIAVGTHAIIQKEKAFARLALAIIDEQHRFGVEQRAALLRHRELVPHFLSMSATPIPRTLALALFSDLDLSIINELPSGRRPIITKIVAPANRQKAYQFIREQIQKGRQAFVICPRIEKTENDSGSAMSLLWNDIKAVKEEYERLKNDVFPDLKVAMLHGKMKSKEKQEIMQDFAQNKVNILLATSVVEVGVDVPNATIMVIEGADRFGLSQLYQFRGRVGRGEHQSFCLLFTDSTSAIVHRRLNSLLEAKNGFELAEKDLALRGPGEFLGQSQTGVPDNLMKALDNIELVKMARQSAIQLLKASADLKKYPSLKARIDQFGKEVHLE